MLGKLDTTKPRVLLGQLFPIHLEQRKSELTSVTKSPPRLGTRGDAGEGCCCCPHPNSQLQTPTKVTDKRSLWPCHNSSCAHPMYQNANAVGRWEFSIPQRDGTQGNPCQRAHRQVLCQGPCH